MEQHDLIALGTKDCFCNVVRVVAQVVVAGIDIGAHVAQPERLRDLKDAIVDVEPRRAEQGR